MVTEVSKELEIGGEEWGESGGERKKAGELRVRSWRWEGCINRGGGS